MLESDAARADSDAFLAQVARLQQRFAELRPRREELDLQIRCQAYAEHRFTLVDEAHEYAQAAEELLALSLVLSAAPEVVSPALQRGVAQRQVECRRLEGPAAVEARDVALGLGREGVEVAHQLAELAQGCEAGEIEMRSRLLQSNVVDSVVRNVLAQSVLAGAPEVDNRAQSFEAGEVELQRLELVPLDLQR